MATSYLFTDNGIKMSLEYDPKGIPTIRGKDINIGFEVAIKSNLPVGWKKGTMVNLEKTMKSEAERFVRMLHSYSKI